MGSRACDAGHDPALGEPLMQKLIERFCAGAAVSSPKKTVSTVSTVSKNYI